MPRAILRNIASLELEEQILNGAALVAMIGVFLPWMSGELLGETSSTYTGFGFYTSLLGIAFFLLLVFILLITIVPLIGGPVLVRKKHREYVRFFAALQATILVLATLSVLTIVTFEYTRMEVRFGIYVSLIGSLVTLLYSFLRLQEFRKAQVQELFHHPEDHASPLEHHESPVPPPPPPPPPPAPEPEEHRIYP